METPRMTSSNLRWLATLLLLSVSAGDAATLTVSSDAVPRLGDPARICVTLEFETGELIAGTENLLVWDGECASIQDQTCEANPAHGKPLSKNVLKDPDFTLKALILSLTDTDPMPAGELYCCDFLVHADPDACCSIALTRPGASDPDGNELVVAAGPPGEACLSTEAPTRLPTSVNTQTPIPTGKPTATQVTDQSGGPAGGPDGGCSMNPDTFERTWLGGLAPGIVVLALGARRRRNRVR